MAISIALTSMRAGSETIHSMSAGGSTAQAIVAGSCPTAEYNTWAATTTSSRSAAFALSRARSRQRCAEHPEVDACAVVAREAPNGEQQLVAYIVGEPGCPSDAEARDWLRRRLPEYMVPSAFVRLSALPTTASGKLDKAALPAPSPRGTNRIGAQPPRNDTERRVAALWADLLAMPVTDVNSDFFDMGGHSLLAARLISDDSADIWCRAVACGVPR